MRRREFITLLGSAATWPLAARARQVKGVRRIGVLLSSTEDDAETQENMEAFRQGLQALGWTPGGNVEFEYRWARANPNLLRTYARELVASNPDVLLTHSVQSVTALRDETRTIPIVFASASDPVDVGLVASLAHPGGNITGFTSIQAATNVKWLELIKEISPQVSRVLVLISSSDPSNSGRFRAIQTAGPVLNVVVTSAEVTTPTSIESAIEAFAREPGGALIVAPNPVSITYGATIIKAAAQFHLPAVYPRASFASAGGLIAYGQNLPGQYRRSAGYVDRILKGANPADLPIQAPTSFELVINLKTARALGLTVTPTLLARADRVIE